MLPSRLEKRYGLHQIYQRLHRTHHSFNSANKWCGNEVQLELNATGDRKDTLMMPNENVFFFFDKSCS